MPTCRKKYTGVSRANILRKLSSSFYLSFLLLLSGDNCTSMYVISVQVCMFFLTFHSLFDVHGITLNTILAFIYPVNVYIRSRLT